ncbi:MAG: MFS transporter, partial [bacterium]|nr:MFS transporter [bacterium]
MALSVPGILLAVLLLFRLARHEHHTAEQAAVDDPEDEAHWGSYALLISTVALAGIVYASLLTFMPRYLNSVAEEMTGPLTEFVVRLGFKNAVLQPLGVANFLTGAVLLLGVVGQYAAGRLAKPSSLEWIMGCAFLASAPCVLWMGFAQGTERIAAAALFAPLFFMHQPVFNSLVA